MYLEQNLTKMNEKYNPLGVRFEVAGDIVKVQQKGETLLLDNVGLREELKSNFKLMWNSTKKFWYIGEEGIARLETRVLKFTPTMAIADMQKQIYEFVNSLEEEPLRQSILNYLEKTPYFFEAPAAKTMHHNYRYGLAEHTLQTIKMARLIAKAFQDEVTVDLDLLIAGALLHDVGKINCYALKGELITTTDIYIKHNHIINGVKLVTQEIKTTKLDDLIHIVASHHNIAEWGSPVEPKTPEAWIIHTVENLSSKIMG